jgi:catechol 2,3-dioxygenase-like lactoylglutathione lyase family enzyme
MILYSTIGTSDMERAIRFYDSVFCASGVSRAPNWSDGWAGWGGSYDEGYGFWVCSPFDGRPPVSGNGTMIAFRAKDELKCKPFTPPHWSEAALTKALRVPVLIMSGVFLSRTYATRTETNSLASTTSTSRNCRAFRHLSPSIVPKRNYLTVDLTVSSLYGWEISNRYSHL